MHIFKNTAELILHYVFAMFCVVFFHTYIIPKEPDSINANNIAITGIVSYLAHKKRNC